MEIKLVMMYIVNHSKLNNMITLKPWNGWIHFNPAIVLNKKDISFGEYFSDITIKTANGEYQLQGQNMFTFAHRNGASILKVSGELSTKEFGRNQITVEVGEVQIKDATSLRLFLGLVPELAKFITISEEYLGRDEDEETCDEWDEYELILSSLISSITIEDTLIECRDIAE